MSAGGSTRVAAGGLIDRDRRLGFSFDGRGYVGCAGDTLASALLANGVALIGRSFKYHRPRGILTAGAEEPNALVTLGEGARAAPNTRATTVELHDGLVARSQNRFPSLRWDVMSAASCFSPLLRAGFYYKTFMWPAGFWEKVYEPLIRRAARLGRASGLNDPDHYDAAYAHCDVLIIGAGPAGLMAAIAAGQTGARVLLCEQDFVLGGTLNAETLRVGDGSAMQWVTRCASAMRDLDNVTVMTRTVVFAGYDGRSYAAVEGLTDHHDAAPGCVRQRLWRIVAAQTIVATGSVERPIGFGNNDRPGVMLASAVRTYLHRFGVRAGERACIFTTTDSGWRCALDLAASGGQVAAVIDARPRVSERLLQAARQRDVPFYLDTQVRGVTGHQHVRRVYLDGPGAIRRLDVDLLAVSGGWNPLLALTSHLGHRPKWEPAISAFVPDALPPALRVAGSVTGQPELHGCLTQGAQAGRDAAEAAGFGRSSVMAPPVQEEDCTAAPLWRSRRARRKVFVDPQNDVTDSDVELAHAEGLRSLEHFKRYTTHGMATDQGKTSGIIGQALFAQCLGQPLAAVGVPIARPPVVPVAIGVIAGSHRGRDYRPTRRTAGHAWAQSQGAQFVEAGEWLRAQWFPQAADRDWFASVARETAAVRRTAGVCDVSTLGKIDLQGSDAGEFLDRIYINTFSTLPVGKARYGVMLREDGFVLDDGTTARLAEHHYLMTTTTANAGRVMQHLQFCHQVLWPTLDVQLTSVTEHWAQYAVAGPRAREVLERLVDEPGRIRHEAFPFLSATTLTVNGGLPARLFRISFSGELGYELAVPARQGQVMLEAIAKAGREYGLIPYGTEALSTLRIEKGHVAGNEINGHTTARDLGLGRMMSSKKDFIGAVLARRPALVDPHRPALVGLQPVRPADRLRGGAHLLRPGVALTPQADEGYVTSVAFSPAMQSWIGLGLLRNGPQRHGESIRVWDPVRSGDFEARIGPPIFVDPSGQRVHG